MTRLRTFFFGYVDIQKMTGQGLNTLYKAVERGDLNPENLESVVKYVIRHAHPDLRIELLRYALEAELPEKPGLRARPKRRGPR